MKNTADLWDAYSERLICCNPIFNAFGKKRKFSGKITTLKLFEDNSFVRKELESNGEGNVLVVDGGASLNCALVGDRLATLAIKNNWSGIIVNGCIRDSAEINAMHIGIRALHTSPVKSIKHNIGQRNIEVQFAGVNFIPGDYVYVDEDGILLSKYLLQ